MSITLSPPGSASSSSSLLTWSTSSAGMVPAASTVFTTLTNGFNATEALRQTVLPPCTIKDLIITTTTAQPGTGALTLEVRQNGVNTGKIITVPAGAAAGVFSAVGPDVTFAAGDLFSVRATNAAPAAVSANVVGIAARISTPL